MKRDECPVCGAELQAKRCPWAKNGTLPGPAGYTFCEWPRAATKKPSDYRLYEK